MRIPFNLPPVTGDEMKYIGEAIAARKICGDGKFTRLCQAWMEERFRAKKVLLTTSGTAALDMAMLLCDFAPGDEVILPSYTFSSTANSIVLGGAIPVFIDIRPDTMNIDEKKIEAAITEKTKAIVVVHYAGVACEMDTIMDIAAQYRLKVVEDAAQGIMSTYKGEALGTIGDYGCYSFHETKNLSMGEGGALVVNHAEDVGRAEIFWEKGTNRSQFYRGQVDKYTWVDFGDSYLPSELNAAYLWAQLQHAEEIQESRMAIWKLYFELLSSMRDAGKIELPSIPKGCEHNAHMFYVKLRNLEERTSFIKYLGENGIDSVFHYVPLHSAPAGKKFGRFCGEDVYTTKESERLVRLPLHYGMKKDDVTYIVKSINAFFNG